LTKIKAKKSNIRINSSGTPSTLIIIDTASMPEINLSIMVSKLICLSLPAKGGQIEPGLKI
jgi:hypothetical protein